MAAAADRLTHVELTMDPDWIDEILPLADKTRKIILLEEGCETFILTRKVDNPGVLVLFAVYSSKQAYEWHLQQDYLKAFFAFLKGKMIGEPAVSYLVEF